MKNENSDRIIKYFEDKYVPSIAIIGLLKCISYVSLFVKNITYPLSIIDVGRKGEFKSRTSIELFDIFNGVYKDVFNDFDNNKIIELGSDITLHEFANESKNGEKVNNKLLLLNDLTLAISSKSDKTINRLLLGFAELMSEGIYIYGDFSQKFKITARCNFIFNMTDVYFRINGKRLINSTFGDRCLIVFNKVKNPEMKIFLSEERKKVNRKKCFPDKIKVVRSDVDYKKYLGVIADLSLNYQYYSLSSSSRMFDKLIAIATSHALLNNRNYVDDTDIQFIKTIEKNLFNPDMYLNYFIIKHFIMGFSLYGIVKKYYQQTEEQKTRIYEEAGFKRKYRYFKNILTEARQQYTDLDEMHYENFDKIKNIVEENKSGISLIDLAIKYNRTEKEIQEICEVSNMRENKNISKAFGEDADDMEEEDEDKDEDKDNF